jgi:SSS family solute:Na+ symporter
MQLSLVDGQIVAVYAVALFGLAQWVSRSRGGEAKTSTEYFLASRSLPWWAIGASLIAANISAEQIVGSRARATRSVSRLPRTNGWRR